MNPAHIITAYLEEHGEKYDLTNSASIRVLALDLQDALDDLHCSLGDAADQEEVMTTEADSLRSRLEQARAGLWYYEGKPEQHCELLSWNGEDVTLRPIDGSPNFTCNGSFVGPVTERRN